MKIKTGVPSINGMYVAYIESGLPDDNYPAKILLSWTGSQWMYTSSTQMYRGEVHGYFGPIPTTQIEELISRPDKKFVIGDIIGVANGEFFSGPFDSLKEALEEYGEKNWYIARVIIDKEPKLVRMWNDEKVEWEKP